LIVQDASSAFGSGDMAQLGKNVFQNAAPYLRVRHGCVAALQNEAEFDAVDDIRIHPQSEAMLQVRRRMLERYKRVKNNRMLE
jgi:hypothetical protein